VAERRHRESARFENPPGLQSTWVSTGLGWGGTPPPKTPQPQTCDGEDHIRKTYRGPANTEPEGPHLKRTQLSKRWSIAGSWKKRERHHPKEKIHGLQIGTLKGGWFAETEKKKRLDTKITKTNIRKGRWRAGFMCGKRGGERGGDGGWARHGPKRETRMAQARPEKKKSHIEGIDRLENGGGVASEKIGKMSTSQKKLVNKS